MLDEGMLTGESIPVSKSADDSIFLNNNIDNNDNNDNENDNINDNNIINNNKNDDN